MADVFISYKAEDRPRVRPLVEALEAEGLSVWWDAHVGGGEAWREAIAEHLESAGCVLVVWSKRSTAPEGRFVRDEASRAQRRGTYLPVIIDKVDPPLGFGETQALPLSGWKGNPADPRYRAVSKCVHAILGREAPAAPAKPGRGLDRRAVLAGGGVAVAVAAAGGGWLLLRPSGASANTMAVLPFANLSGDPAQTYFSDGIAEELRSALSRIAGFKVVARTSSEMVRQSDAKTAARKLGVEHIVSGSVRRSPAMIRVNAQLVDGRDGLERWSQTFDRPAGDLLEIQTSIAESVAQALSVRLGGTDREALTLGGTRNPAAQDLYLQADLRGQSDTKDALTHSLGLLNAAIALDPNYAMAHARKAFVLLLLAGVYALSKAESDGLYRQSSAAVERAIAIEPRLAFAYSTRAALLRDKLNMGGAIAEFEKADSLPGDDAHTLRTYAFMLAQSKRFAEAQRKIELAKSLDPLNPVSFEVEAVIFVYSGRFEEGLAAARRSLQIAPERMQVRRILGNTLLLMGKPDEAAAEYARLEPNDYRRLLGEAVIAARAGDRAKAMDKLRTMRERYGDAALYQYGQIYAQLGMTEEAIAALRKALEVRDPGMAHIRADGFLDPLRSDPRFAAIEKRLNFPA